MLYGDIRAINYVDDGLMSADNKEEARNDVSTTTEENIKVENNKQDQDIKNIKNSGNGEYIEDTVNQIKEVEEVKEFEVGIE